MTGVHARRSPRRPPRGPDPAGLAALLATVWLEVDAGRRPVAHLLALVAPALGRRLTAQLRAVPCDRPRTPMRVRRVQGGHPHARAFEAAVVVTDGTRTSALAVRLERHLGAWRGVELTAPEAGLPALRTASLRVAPTRPDAFDEVLGDTALALEPGAGPLALPR
jgi:hypothetical protein